MRASCFDVRGKEGKSRREARGRVYRGRKLVCSLIDRSQPSSVRETIPRKEGTVNFGTGRVTEIWDKAPRRPFGKEPV